MKNNRYILVYLVLISLLCIVSISAISASENNTNEDIISTDNNQQNNVEINQNYEDVSTNKDNSDFNLEENNNGKQVTKYNVKTQSGMSKSTKKKPHLTYKIGNKKYRMTEKEYYKIKAHKYDGYNRIKPTGEYFVIKKKMKTIQRLYFNSFHENKKTAIRMELKTIRPYLKNGYVLTGKYIRRAGDRWKVNCQLTRKYFVKRLPIYWQIGAGEGHVYLLYCAQGINYFRKGDFHTEAIYSPKLHRYCVFDITKYF